MTEPELPKHVIIVGHGRSGTNMVLDLFDCHLNTFCRNEAYSLVGTAFTGLGDRMFIEPEPDDFAVKWRLAISETMRTSGVRDRFVTEKDYFRSALRTRIGQSLMSRGKFRACILPRLDGRVTEQWSCPSFYYDSQAQAHAFPVLKVLLSPAWISKAHDQILTQLVVHVLRRPQGFIQSWWSRYVIGIGGGPEKVFADNQPSLVRILQHFGKEDEMPRQYSLGNLIASEMWRWRYLNEIMLEQLSGSRRYMKLEYESVMRNKLHWAEKMYGFAGLEMTPGCRQSVKAMENTLFPPRKPDGVDPVLIDEVVGAVMAGSPYQGQLLRPDAGLASATSG